MLNIDFKACIDRFDPSAWLPRVLIAAMFIESGCDKLLHWGTYVAEVSAHHIPFGGVSLFAAMAIELIGAVALLSGLAAAPALLALAFYTIVVNFFYFDFWNMNGAAAIGARKECLKNLAVAGGVLAYLYLYVKTRQVAKVD